MPRPRAIASAIATCAAAKLAAPANARATLTPDESGTASAVARLGAHAASDALEALAAPRYARRRLDRALRRLRLAYALSVQLHAVDDPAAFDAGVSFAAAARLAADRFGQVARRPGHRLERSAVRALRRAARMQNEVASSIAVIAGRKSFTGPGVALREVLDAQRELMAAVEHTISCEAVRARRRRSLRSIPALGERVSDQLASALICVPFGERADSASEGRRSGDPAEDRRQPG